MNGEQMDNLAERLVKALEAIQISLNEVANELKSMSCYLRELTGQLTYKPPAEERTEHEEQQGKPREEHTANRYSNGYGYRKGYHRKYKDYGGRRYGKDHYER